MFDRVNRDQGDDGSTVSHHCRIGGGAPYAPPPRGFLSLMRAVVALLGFLVMAATSRRHLRTTPG